jgi:hypothetical protein
VAGTERSKEERDVALLIVRLENPDEVTRLRSMEVERVR